MRGGRNGKGRRGKGRRGNEGRKEWEGEEGERE